MMALLLYSFLIAVIAVTYRLILAYEPILSWWFQFGNNYSKKWFYAPIWGCEKCFAGQLAFWVYILNVLSVIFGHNRAFLNYLSKIIPLYHSDKVNALNGLIFVSAAILFTFLLSKLITNLKNKY